MAQEFFINSQALEDQIRTILPSQGGQGAGFDLSASTQIIPIIDITPGTSTTVLRQDLQSSISFNDISVFDVSGATTTIINSTGYFLLKGAINTNSGQGSRSAQFILNDGSTDKIFLLVEQFQGSFAGISSYNFEYNVFLNAGDTVKLIASSNLSITGLTKQIASIDGTLSTPS